MIRGVTDFPVLPYVGSVYVHSELPFSSFPNTNSLHIKMLTRRQGRKTVSL